MVNSNNLHFPHSILSGVAWDYANLYSSYIEPPIEFFYMSFLTCLGNILSDKLTLESEISPQPRFNVLLLGKSADDRKSTAIKKTVKFFGDTLSYCEGVGSAEGLQKELKDKKNMVLCFDELQQFVGKVAIQSSVLLPCVTSLFEQNTYESHTKHKSLKLEDAYLSILAASTVETYEKIWDSNFTNIGFTNRLFLVSGSGARKFSVPGKIPTKDKISLLDRVKVIIDTVGDRLEMKITKEAFEAYDWWYHNLEVSIHAKRLDTYALRFMPLMAINEMKTEVDIDIVDKVIGLMNWELEVRKAYDPIDADNEMAKMEEKIRRILKARGELTTRELKQYTNANRVGIWFYYTAIDNLKRSLEIIYGSETQKWELIEE